MEKNNDTDINKAKSNNDTDISNVGNNDLSDICKAERKDLGLYIHIPFCAKKCDYCDFLSSPASKETVSKYIDALLTEIEQYGGTTDQYKVSTIFIGGGTPSYINAVHIERIMEAVNRVFHINRANPEVTIEINPGTIDEDKLRTYQRLGINRLSFGLQSVNNDELALLGRIHTYEQFEENYRLARSLGFGNINIDLISAIPSQTLGSWENTLNKVIELNPEHISAYSLIVEEGTKFYNRYREGTVGYKDLPDEDTDRLIYSNTKEILQKHGYHRYEISNYAKEEFECQHNSIYWTGKDYLGVGLGASSLLDDARISNVHDIAQYIERCNLYKEELIVNRSLNTIMKTQPISIMDSVGIREDIQRLTQPQKMEEFMFLGLRMVAGISRTDFLDRFGVDIDSVYGEIIKHLVRDSLLVVEGDNILLTEFGIDVSNYVFVKFLLN
jgi:oxygen-independent coproporphyrinogen III oxidase